MVRAGVVRHPSEWPHGGYNEIQCATGHGAVIDLEELSRLCGFASVQDLRQAHREWVAQGLAGNALQRDECWSEAIAVGGEDFVQRIKRELGIAARHRQVAQVNGNRALRESMARYIVDFGLENRPART